MEVECVREGCQLEALRHMTGSESTKRCLTVVFKGPRKSLELLCQSEEEAQQWARGIRTLQERMDNMTHKEKLDQYPFPACLCSFLCEMFKPLEEICVFMVTNLSFLIRRLLFSLLSLTFYLDSCLPEPGRREP